MKYQSIAFYLTILLVTGCARPFDIYMPETAKSNFYSPNNRSALERELEAYAKEINASNINSITDRIYVYPDPKSFIKWNILNRSGNTISINYEKTYYLFRNRNYSVFSNKGKVREKVANRIIQPEETVNVTFYSPDLEGKFFDKLVIAVEMENNISYFEIPWRKSVEPFASVNEKFIGRVEHINVAEQVLCVSTAIFAGGYCWAVIFSKPTESDFQIARSKAADKFNQYENIDKLIVKWAESTQLD